MNKGDKMTDFDLAAIMIIALLGVISVELALILADLRYLVGYLTGG